MILPSLTTNQIRFFNKQKSLVWIVVLKELYIMIPYWTCVAWITSISWNFIIASSLINDNNTHLMFNFIKQWKLFQSFDKDFYVIFYFKSLCPGYISTIYMDDFDIFIQTISEILFSTITTLYLSIRVSHSRGKICCNAIIIGEFVRTLVKKRKFILYIL